MGRGWGVRNLKLVTDLHLVPRSRMSGAAPPLLHAASSHTQIQMWFYYIFSGTKRGDKISRPPNAFMVFCKEKRRELAAQCPEDTNKDISKM